MGGWARVVRPIAELGGFEAAGVSYIRTEPPSAPAVRIRGLTRRFGGQPVLDGLDLEIAAGAFVALLGRSGSGKTTLLRSLAGLDPVTEGSMAAPDRRAVVF